MDCLIGQKYESVEALSLERAEGMIFESPPAVAAFEETLRIAVSNMKQLESYQCQIYPFTEAIARAIDDNSEVGLEYLYLSVANDTWKQQLNAFTIATEIFDTLTTLEVREMLPWGDNDIQVDKDLYCGVIGEACKKMPDLHRFCSYTFPSFGDYGSQFLADILQQLPHIEELEIHYLSLNNLVKTDWTITEEGSRI